MCTRKEKKNYIEIFDVILFTKSKLKKYKKSQIFLDENRVVLFVLSVGCFCKEPIYMDNNDNETQIFDINSLFYTNNNNYYFTSL